MTAPDQRFLYHERRGAGPAVVLLHPGGLDGRIWARLAPCLAETSTVVSLDRPGHGHNIDELRVRATSTPTSEQYQELVSQLRRDDDEIEQIEALLESLGLGSVAVLGLGDGGMAALHLAGRGHVPVDSIVLINTTVTVPPEASLEQILDGCDASGIDGPAMAEIMATVLETKDPTPYVDWVMSQDDLSAVSSGDQALMRTMLTDNAMSSLLTTGGQYPGSLTDTESAAITAPVLALRAGPPPAGPPEPPLTQALPHAQVTTAHATEAPPCYPLTMPDDCCRRIRAFLSR